MVSVLDLEYIARWRFVLCVCFATSTLKFNCWSVVVVILFPLKYYCCLWWFFPFALHNFFCEILQFLLPMFDVDIDVEIFSTLKKSV